MASGSSWTSAYAHYGTAGSARQRRMSLYSTAMSGLKESLVWGGQGVKTQRYRNK
jgi:hypothetical protein